MKTMKVLEVVGSIWLIMLTTQAYSGNIVFNVEDSTPETYSTFLTSVRVAVKEAKKCHGIDMIKKAPTTKYLLVELTFNLGTFKLAFLRSDLYLEGYSYIYNGKCRYRTFKDSETDAKDVLCSKGESDVKQSSIPYQKSYAGMESKGGNRKKLGLGKYTLLGRMRKIYGKDVTDKNTQTIEAQFLLTAVQMIPEASRFKYIETEITDNFDSSIGYLPDDKAISLELNWASISEAIAKVKKAGDSVMVTLPTPWDPATINQLQEDIMGLLKHVNCQATSFMLPEIKSSYYYRTSIINLGDQIEEI